MVGLTFERLKLSDASDELKLTKRSLQIVPCLDIRDSHLSLLLIGWEERTSRADRRPWSLEGLGQVCVT